MIKSKVTGTCEHSNLSSHVPVARRVKKFNFSPSQKDGELVGDKNTMNENE